MLHGGPGAGCSAKMRRFHDPAHYRIILFDQRGIGRSTPHADLVDNTTWDLVADIEKLREHLGIARWQVFGGSWGSTLALAYAADASGARHRTGAARHLHAAPLGTGMVLPGRRSAACSRMPGSTTSTRSRRSSAHDLISAYHRRLTSRRRGHAAGRGARLVRCGKARPASCMPDEAFIDGHEDAQFALSFARIENHYFVNGGFFEVEDQLLRDAHRLHGHPRRHRARPLRRGLPGRRTPGTCTRPGPKSELVISPSVRPFGVRGRESTSALVRSDGLASAEACRRASASRGCRPGCGRSATARPTASGRAHSLRPSSAISQRGASCAGTSCTVMSSLSSPPPACDRVRPRGAHEGDAFVAHAGRGRADQQHFDVRGLPAGFLDQFALARPTSSVSLRIGRRRPGRPASRCVRAPSGTRYCSTNSSFVVGRDGDDDHRHAAGVGAFGVFPVAALHHAQPVAFVNGFDRFVGSWRPMLSCRGRELSCSAAARVSGPKRSCSHRALQRGTASSRAGVAAAEVVGQRRVAARWWPAAGTAGHARDAPSAASACCARRAGAGTALRRCARAARPAMPKCAEQDRRGLRADARHAGDVVDGIAGQAQVVGDLVRMHAMARP